MQRMQIRALSRKTKRVVKLVNFDSNSKIIFA